MFDQFEVYVGLVGIDKTLDLFHGVVGRVIVDDDAFEIRIALTTYGLETILDVL
jgi:hypothetical protein